MTVKSFGGGGGSGGATPALMANDADTVYNGRVVTGAWADVSVNADSHSDINTPLYVDDTNTPGQGGVYFPNLTGIRTVGVSSPCQILPPLTVELVASVWWDNDTTPVVCSGTGETEAGNTIYSVRNKSTGPNIETFFEHGAGTNRSLQDAWKPQTVDMAGGWHHWCTVYEADGTCILYIDGNLVTSTEGTAATGGSAAYLTIGSFQGNTGTSWPGLIRDVRISDVAKGASWVLAEANAALGL